MMDDASESEPIRTDRSARSAIRWDRWTAIMATLVGICALGVSLYTAILQNRQIEAQTWPYLQLWNSTGERTFSLSNRGVGPARIRDVKLRVDGKEVASFEDAFRLLAGRPLSCSRQSFFARRVLAANEDVAMIEFCDDADFAVFAGAGDRLVREVCYCSLLGQCAVIDEAASGESGYDREVQGCPVGRPGIFR